MKITLTSIAVNDQAKAVAFYTEKLGFKKNKDIPMGEHRWLTVTSPEGIDGVELVLEPLSFPPAVDYYKALYDAGIPATMFETNNFDAEIAKLKDKGVVFRGEPHKGDGFCSATFDDTCGNLICIAQQTG